jgi:hypothetical protein
MSTFAMQDTLKIAVLESADIELAPNNGTKKIKVVTVKEIEPSITSIIIFDRSGYFVQVFDSARRVINSRDKLDISAIGCFHQFDQNRHAVNRFFQRRILHFPCAVPVFHPTVVLKERNIIRHSLDSKNETELVIHLYGYFAHPMFDTSSFDPRVKIIAHFILIAAVEFAAKKCGDILGFDRVYGGADNFAIDQFKVTSSLEYDVCSVFNLYKTPMIVIDKVLNNRAVLPDGFIQLPMNTLDVDVIRKLLSFGKIADLYKDIIKLFRDCSSNTEFF